MNLSSYNFFIQYKFHLRNARMHEFPSRNTWIFIKPFYLFFIRSLCVATICIACMTKGGVEHIISGKFCYFFFNLLILHSKMLFCFSRVEKFLKNEKNEIWFLPCLLFPYSKNGNAFFPSSKKQMILMDFNFFLNFLKTFNFFTLNWFFWCGLLVSMKLTRKYVLI